MATIRIPEQRHQASIVVMAGDCVVSQHIMLNAIMTKWKFKSGLVFGSLPNKYPNCIQVQEYDENFFKGYHSVLCRNQKVKGTLLAPNYLVIEGDAKCLQTEYLTNFMSNHRSTSNTTVFLLMPSLPDKISVTLRANTTYACLWPTAFHDRLCSMYNSYGIGFDTILKFNSKLNKCIEHKHSCMLIETFKEMPEWICAPEPVN